MNPALIIKISLKLRINVLIKEQDLKALNIVEGPYLSLQLYQPHILRF